MSLPVAITEQLIQFYGDPMTYFRQAEVLERGPYESLVAELAASGWKIDEYTDPQSDVCRAFVLTRGDRQFVNLKLSLVGPYALIGVGDVREPESGWFLDTEDVRDDAVGDVLDKVLRAGFRLLPQDLLSQRVDLWHDPHKDLLLVLGGTCGSLYGYLFCFDPDEYEPDECSEEL